MSISLWCALLLRASTATVIVPEFDPTIPHWNDTDGSRIEAHSAGMLQSPQDGRWYWYGETKKTADISTHGVSCYSAATIAGPWTYEGQALNQSDIVMHGTQGPFIVERPKVVYNNATDEFVMWFHLDTAGYKFRHAGVAVSKSPSGRFTFVHGLQPDGIPSLDMSLFLDPLDGQAYFVRSCDNSYVGISRLTPDFLNTTGVISTHSKFEGMALFRMANGTYYIITSHLTGWNPNPLMLFRAAGKTLDDPQWVFMGNPTGDATSFNSQPTYVVQYTPANKSVAPYFVYMADNWVHAGPNGLIDAGYVWLPFNFHDDGVTVTLDKLTHWDIDNPFKPRPSCSTATPTVGARLSLQPCVAGATSQQFVVGSSIAVKGNSTLQVKAVGSRSSSGNGNGSASTHDLRLVEGAGDPVTYDASSGNIRRTDNGQCLDLTFCGNSPCAGYFLEYYACNHAHENQEFRYDATTGVIQSQLKGQSTPLCVAACAQ